MPYFEKAIKQEKIVLGFKNLDVILDTTEGYVLLLEPDLERDVEEDGNLLSLTIIVRFLDFNQAIREVTTS